VSHRNFEKSSQLFSTVGTDLVDTGGRLEPARTQLWARSYL